MLERSFGWTDTEVPVAGMGTWMIEGDSHDIQHRAIQTIKQALDLGMTYIDTAEMYGNGMQRD